MKLSKRSSATLLALLAATAVGSNSVLAATALELDSTGTVEVKEADDTNPGPEIPDPEKPDPVDPVDPIDPNPTSGPLKVEKVTKLNFGEIETTTGEITKPAAAYQTSGGPRGAMVTFADVRTTASGYTLNAKLSEQFKGNTTGAYLTGSKISYSNGIARLEKDNTNTPGTLNKSAFVLTTNSDTEVGESVTVYTADKATKQGKGRTVLEFGQSDTYDPTSNPTPPGSNLGTGTAGTAAKSVNLIVPSGTASGMVDDTYVAKITWSLVAAP